MHAQCGVLNIQFKLLHVYVSPRGESVRSLDEGKGSVG